MIQRLLVCACLALFLTGCETMENDKKSSTSKHTYDGATFSLQYPSNVTPAYDQGDGYAVHFFRLGVSKCMMGVYEGLRPRLFARDQKDLTVLRTGATVRPGIERGDDRWGVDSNGKIWRESVWSCQRTLQDKEKKYQLPTMIHVWYFGASEDEQQVFDSIAETIRMK